MAEKHKTPLTSGDPDAPRIEKQPVHQRVVEQIPSTIGGISALASAHAPHIFFSDVPYCGYLLGSGDITLTAVRHIANVEGHGVAGDQVITAVLHASLDGLRALKGAIDAVEQLAAAQTEAAVAAGSTETGGRAH